MRKYIVNWLMMRRQGKPANSKKRKLLLNRLAHGFMAAVVIFSLVYGFVGSHLFLGSAKAASYSAGPRGATASGDCVNDSSIGTIAWDTPGEAYSSNNGAFINISITFLKRMVNDE